MQAEIISNGDELTCGKILDTNARWLTLELADLGITTLFHTTVGDDLDAMIDVLRVASRRVDLIVWTGGLGPTADDLTRRAVADWAGVPLERNEESLKRIRETFRRRGRDMPSNNEVQSFQPKGARAIANPHGTAPGIDFTVKRTGPPLPGRLDFVRVLAYPGVPAEMREMWFGSGRQTVQDLLDGLREHRRVLRFRSIHSFGLGESQVEAMLPDIVNRQHFPKVGITADHGTITLRIAAEGATEQECFEIMEPTARLIREKLGDLVFGEDDDRMQDVVCRLLNARGRSLAVVEAGTRGLLAEAIAGADGAEQCFAGGIVLPGRKPVEPEEMIRRGRRLFDIDDMLLVGPYPPGRPDRDRSEKVFVAVADPAQGDTWQAIPVFKEFSFVGHPDIIDNLFIQRALNLLRKRLSTPR